MTRPLLLLPGAVYHIMNRGLARRPVVRTAADRRAFLMGVADAHALWGSAVSADCLMATHDHLVLQTPEASLPRVRRHRNGLSTSRFHRAHGRDGPLVRGRYRAC